MIDTTAYKQRLEDEKTNLEEQLASVGRKNPSNENDWEATQEAPSLEADVLDRAASLDNYQENNAILTDLEIRLTDVNDALARIEKGTYGICEVSGEEIEADRLDADPAARTNKANMNQ